MALINITLASKMTGIEDLEVLQFYIDATIKKIERIIGYPLSQTTQNDYIRGVNTSYLWLNRKPVSGIVDLTIDKELIDPSDYELREAEFNPHIVLNEDKYIVCDDCKAKVNNTAGYTDFNGLLPLDPDIQALIFGTIKSFESYIDNGELKSYKIDTIAYEFTSWINNNQNFYNQIYDVFGLNI